MKAHSRIEKKKVKHESGSTGNVWVQRYTGLICAKPSLTVLEVELSTCARVNFCEGAYSELPIEGEVELKEWKCVEVKHHKDVGGKVEEWQKNGWRLHTYQATGRDVWITHYLLFEKGE